MFRASDIFGGRHADVAGSAGASSSAAVAFSPSRAGSQAASTEHSKRALEEASAVNTVWDPATGTFVEESIPAEIQELMGIKKPKLELSERQESAGSKRPKLELSERQDRASMSAAAPVVSAVSSPGRSAGLEGHAPAPAAERRPSASAPEAAVEAPSAAAVDRSGPSVQYKGFNKAELDDRYYEQPSVVVHGRSTYWTGDGQFFIYWQGEEVQRWSICDAANLAAVKAGQLPGWAYQSDHKHLAQASGWMAACDGEWRPADLQVTFRSAAHHPPQWEDYLLQRSTATVNFQGFSFKDLNTRYHLRLTEVIQGRPSYWDSTSVFFIYWQKQLQRWAICDIKCLDAVREGQCPGWAYRLDSGHFANACGWVETRSGQWFDANVETAVVGVSTFSLKVEFTGFSKPGLNATYSERPHEEVQGRPTFWEPTGTYFVYWQESFRRWAICDNLSLHLAKNGLAPGWAYISDSEHFARAISWYEAIEDGWRECAVCCKVLEGSVSQEDGLQADRGEEPDRQRTAQEYRDLVRKIYELKNPVKLPHLAAIFDKYDGRELDLFDSVCAKYDVDPNSIASHMPRAVEQGAAVPELEASGYVALVRRVYEQYNPRKLQDLEKLVQKFKARERELYLEVCKKYSVNPAIFYARLQAEQVHQDRSGEPG